MRLIRCLRLRLMLPICFLRSANERREMRKTTTTEYVCALVFGETKSFCIEMKQIKYLNGLLTRQLIDSTFFWLMWYFKNVSCQFINESSHCFVYVFFSFYLVLFCCKIEVVGHFIIIISLMKLFHLNSIDYNWNEGRNVYKIKINRKFVQKNKLKPFKTIWFNLSTI